MILRPPLRRREAFLLLVTLAVTPTACSPRARPGDSRPASAAVVVENRSWSDVVVYLADGNVPFRLGRVPALDRARLAIPNHAAALGVRIFVRSLASSEMYAGEPLLPGAGGVLELTVQPHLAQSTVSVLSYGPLER